MRKLIALLAVLCLLTASVPALAFDFGLGALEDLFSESEEKEDADELDHLFEGDTIQIYLTGTTIEVHEQFKNVMDSYVEFFDEYVAYMNDPSQNPAGAVSLLSRYAELIEALDELEDDEDEMSDGDLAYYLYATGLIYANLATVE